MKKILNYTEFVNEGVKQDIIIPINETLTGIEKSDVLKYANKQLYNFVMKLLYGPNLENKNNPQPNIKELETHIWGRNLSQIVSTGGILWNETNIIDDYVDYADGPATYLPALEFLMRYKDDLSSYSGSYESKIPYNTDFQKLDSKAQEEIESSIHRFFKFSDYSKDLKKFIYSNSKVNYKSDLGLFGGRERMISRLPGYKFSKITDVTKTGDFLLNKLCYYTFDYLKKHFWIRVSENYENFKEENSSTDQNKVSTDTASTEKKSSAVKIKSGVKRSSVAPKEITSSDIDLSKIGY